eukprot:TRINITY_DN16984_c0_g1_i1.p1 TRINITY_DN16984_c0_g1~~TRINITY_DN16984_c0_g1_i1.p1  ORF type:complete len:647 (+),score=129.33 TRINITY_DN16984_c0_g1_i1:680-2620(+)
MGLGEENDAAPGQWTWKVVPTAPEGLVDGLKKEGDGHTGMEVEKDFLALKAKDTPLEPPFPFSSQQGDPRQSLGFAPAPAHSFGGGPPLGFPRRTSSLPASTFAFLTKGQPQDGVATNAGYAPVSGESPSRLASVSRPLPRSPARSSAPFPPPWSPPVPSGSSMQHSTSAGRLTPSQTPPVSPLKPPFQPPFQPSQTTFNSGFSNGNRAVESGGGVPMKRKQRVDLNQGPMLSLSTPAEEVTTQEELEEAAANEDGSGFSSADVFQRETDGHGAEASAELTLGDNRTRDLLAGRLSHTQGGAGGGLNPHRGLPSLLLRQRSAPSDFLRSNAMAHATLMASAGGHVVRGSGLQRSSSGMPADDGRGLDPSALGGGSPARGLLDSLRGLPKVPERPPLYSDRGEHQQQQHQFHSFVKSRGGMGDTHAEGGLETLRLTSPPKGLDFTNQLRPPLRPEIERRWGASEFGGDRSDVSMVKRSRQMEDEDDEYDGDYAHAGGTALLAGSGGSADFSDMMAPESNSNTVPCKARAKRGCATHPRSIAERMRRTRISDGIKKLQELLPSIDKQANTADMLEEAIEFVKFLKWKVKEASRSCTCGRVLPGGISPEMEYERMRRGLTVVGMGGGMGGGEYEVSLRRLPEGGDHYSS